MKGTFSQTYFFYNIYILFYANQYIPETNMFQVKVYPKQMYATEEYGCMNLSKKKSPHNNQLLLVSIHIGLWIKEWLLGVTRNESELS